MYPLESVGKEVHMLDNAIFKTLVAYESERNVDEVTVMHGWVIAYLYDHQEEEVFQKDIEAEFAISKSTVTGILKLMEKKGYITRESVERDHRLKRISLTQKGRELQEGTVESFAQLEDVIRRDVEAQDMTIFFRVISRMKQNLQAWRTKDENHQAEELQACPEHMEVMQDIGKEKPDFYACHRQEDHRQEDKGQDGQGIGIDIKKLKPKGGYDPC